jgi:hypothetical protein
MGERLLSYRGTRAAPLPRSARPWTVVEIPLTVNHRRPAFRIKEHCGWKAERQ